MCKRITFPQAGFDRFFALLFHSATYSFSTGFVDKYKGTLGPLLRGRRGGYAAETS